jgi:hypothetical protein
VTPTAGDDGGDAAVGLATVGAEVDEWHPQQATVIIRTQQRCIPNSACRLRRVVARSMRPEGSEKLSELRDSGLIDSSRVAEAVRDSPRKRES